MANICLAFGTTTGADKIRKALTTVEGLKAWWTDGASGNPAEDGTLTFRFGGPGGLDMRVIRNNAEQVQWEVLTGPGDWVGTRIEFDIKADNGKHKLMFLHAGWKGENPFFYHCSMKWATFLLSLRDYVESGKGKPFPNDVQIDVTGK